MEPKRCMGITTHKNRCRDYFLEDGLYCYKHKHQANPNPPCMCLLDNGDKCPYYAVANDLCEYHQEPSYCKGKTILGGKCLRAISDGSYCWNCKGQEDVIESTVKTAAEEYRGYLIREGNPAIPTKTVNFVTLSDEICIPSDLKKVELAKPDTCCICLEDMTSKYRSLTCGHYFHDVCLSGIDKFNCPMCRSEIQSHSIPQWIRLRIYDNIKESTEQRDREHEEMAMEFVRNVSRENLFEMNSSEEEDFHTHLQNGEEFGLTMIQDVNGHDRIALVLIEN